VQVGKESKAEHISAGLAAPEFDPNKRYACGRSRTESRFRQIRWKCDTPCIWAPCDVRIYDRERFFPGTNSIMSST
jgi:hypothetical protein